MATIRGGEKLEAALREMAQGLAAGAKVKVGFLAKSKYPNGTPVAMIAAIQDFGAPKAGIPPRPFFRNMIKDKSGEWPAAIAGLLKSNGYDAKRTLDLTGEAIEGQLRKSIIDTNAPPLKPATIKRKGFAKPLIDTSVMINSIGHEVV